MSLLKNFIRYVLPIIAWMGLIFYSSSQPAKDQDLAPLLESWISAQELKSVLPAWTIHFRDEAIDSQVEPFRFVNFLVRKCAHIFSFGFLAILFVRAFHSWRWPLKRSLIDAWLASTIYGLFDEIHQWTVPGRTGAIEDVVIDSIGACLGCLAYFYFLTMRQNRKRSKDRLPAGPT